LREECPGEGRALVGMDADRERSTNKPSNGPSRPVLPALLGVVALIALIFVIFAVITWARYNT
jgi:hypothetical protein